jgi:hypothetical protein
MIACLRTAVNREDVQIQSVGDRVGKSADSGMAPADHCIGKVDPGIPFPVPGNGTVDPQISLANSKSDLPDPELARVIKSSTFSIFAPRPPINPIVILLAWCRIHGAQRCN